jgi:Domain of unknown function (DUF4331)
VSAHRLRLAVAIAGSILLLVAGMAPSLVFGADHLDAPGLMPPSGRFQADINDVYAFEGSDAGKTVLTVTTNPAAGVFSPTSFGSDVLYELKVDQDGDAVEDLAYKIRFSTVRNDGSQKVIVKRAVGRAARGHTTGGGIVAQGRTGQTLAVSEGGSFFAGLRSDPFFFDLDAFLGTIGAVNNGRTFLDGNENDFFEALNTQGIILEVPDTQLGDEIGVWATTSVENETGDWVQVDRMGRPAINTVFNTTALGGDTNDKNPFNRSHPSDDRANFGDNLLSVLQTLSALDTEGAYTDQQAATLAGILLPDILTYDTTTAAEGPLNGRALADDVIDIELNIVTGGFAFPGRDGSGAIPGDGVGPHADYLPAFPYLGEPHS